MVSLLQFPTTAGDDTSPTLSDVTAPEDRMPTIEELHTFDPSAAWDRLSPEQQRQIGILAVELSVTGGLLDFENVYSKHETDEIGSRASDALTLLYDVSEPFWPVMFGWDLDEPQVPA